MQGFAKLRRGILEHLKSGRMVVDEYSVFTLVIQLADWKSGIWIGSGVCVSDYLKWCPRKCQLVLKSLDRKGYIELRAVHGRNGNYPILVRKYFGSPNGSAVKTGISEHGCGDKAGSPNGGATLKEVVQEERLRSNTAQTRRVSHSPEKIRQIEAKQKRLQDEAQFYRDVHVGQGPVCVGGVSESYLKRKGLI